jgi:hypothetical protein
VARIGIGKKGLFEKIRSVYEETLSIVCLEIFPTLRTAVLRAGSWARIGIRKKRSSEENPLTFCAVQLSLQVGHSVLHRAWLPLTVAAKQQTKAPSKQMPITTEP